jgi:hypothetical protein
LPLPTDFPALPGPDIEAATDTVVVTLDATRTRGR